MSSISRVYEPSLPPYLSEGSFNDLLAYTSWLQTELHTIAGSIQRPIIPLLYAEPLKPSNGMIVFADGASWDPGLGRGLYHYDEADAQWHLIVDGLLTPGLFLRRALNLSDLASVPTARSNLGLGALAVLNEVGSAQITDGAIVNADVNASAAIDSTKLSYLQSGGGASARTVQARLRDIVFHRDFSDDAAGITAALAAHTHVRVPAGTHNTTSARTVGSGKLLELDAGASLTSSGGGSWALASGGSVISKTEGVEGNVWYWGRKLTGAINAGAGAFGGYSPIGFHFDIIGDNATLPDVATDPFLRGMAINHVTQASITGGRKALQVQLSVQGTPTDDGAVDRNYVGMQSAVAIEANVNGTNTGAGAKGAAFGGGIAAYQTAAATNLFDFVGVELNTFSAAGGTKKYHSTLSVVGFNAERGVDIDAAIRIAGGSQPPFTHAGWKTGILFTDRNGADPFYASSKLMDTLWTGTKTVDRGFDLNGLACTNEILRTSNFRLAANLLSFTGASAFAIIDCAADSTTNCALHLRSKGSSSIFIEDESGNDIAEFSPSNLMTMTTASANLPRVYLINSTNDATGPAFIMEKKRGSSIVQNGDVLGSIYWDAWDGDQMHGVVAIQAVVNGTPGNNDVPTRLDFYTSSDGGVAVDRPLSLGGGSDSDPVFVRVGSTLKGVTQGAVDSGGAGFRLLRVGN